MLELVYEDAGTVRRVRVRDGLTIGRASDNDVVLRDFSVSRHHARIEKRRETYRVVDLGSTNGVVLNGSLVREAVLSPGDRLEIGSFTMVVRSLEQGEEPISSATYMRPLAEFDRDYGLEQPRAVTPTREGVERERVFEILAQVAKTLLEAGELRPVLEKVMEVVFEYLKVDRGYIVLFDEKGDAHLELYRSRETGVGEAEEVPISRTILQLVRSKKVALLTHDAQADQRFEAGQSVRIHGIRSAMCVPLWHRQRIIGVIYVDSPIHVGSFCADDLDLLTALANYAAVAIERAQLNERIRYEEHVRRRLERYHSPAVIESVLADPEQVEPSVTAREVSVLFGDIAGFTSLCESAAPEDVARFLNQFFSRAAEAIFRHGGTLDKFIGDAVMAFFGAPLPQADHAERAVRAAVDLLESVEEWNQERRSQGLEPVRIRVAVNSGPAVVGDIGSQRRIEYTVLGNTVNVAARLEEFVAQPGQIVIGETTHEALGGVVPTEPLGEVRLKGLSRAIAAYRVATERIVVQEPEVAP